MMTDLKTELGMESGRDLNVFSRFLFQVGQFAVSTVQGFIPHKLIPKDRRTVYDAAMEFLTEDGDYDFGEDEMREGKKLASRIARGIVLTFDCVIAVLTGLVLAAAAVYGFIAD